jgi:hypothetical protein
LSQKFASANQAIPKTATGLCLPATAQGLQQLWMGQMELTLNIPRPEARAFVTATASAISSVPSAELLSLVPVAKKTFTSNVTDKKTIATFVNGRSLYLCRGVLVLAWLQLEKM